MVFENRILRKIFGPKCDANGEWRNFVVCTIRVIISRRLRWAGHVARMLEGKSAFKILTGTPTGKRPFGRPKRRWEDNIRMDLK